MPSPAQRQVEAEEEVERIAKALYELIRGSEWESIGGVGKDRWLGYARVLLQRGVIQPGPRQPRIEVPLFGQTTIEEHLDPFALEDDCDADD